MITHADCEQIVEGFLRQPVNAVSSLVFVLAGSLVLLRPRMRWVAWALISVGIGSFIFHGPMPSWGEWIHDVGLAWLLIVVVGYGRSWERYTQLPALVALCLLLAVNPDLGDPVAVVAAGVAVLGLLIRDRSLHTIGALMLLSASAILGRMGATGGAWCRPDSLFQLHAIWHIGAAVAVTWWALTTADANSDQP